MHELSITESIVDACCERADGVRVLRVTVEVGTLSCVMADSLRFCFDVVAAGTELENATLEIIRIPALCVCRDCGERVEMDSLLTTCPCGSANLAPPQGGDQLRIKSMELEEAA